MESPGFDTPILLIVFNRPETTRAVFESIRSVRPPALYVAADGPRENVEMEAQRCEEARRIATAVDWDCEVRTHFQDRNLGCGLNVSSAVGWYFDNVAQGIVLEDDCVPSQSFYNFCQDLLEYYKDNPRIMHIAGNSWQYGRRRGDASYYFSSYANVWGWASWSRAWKCYDFNLRPSWDLRDTWDTQWQLSIERCNGVAIVPNTNLVKNVGFGLDATHTKTLERYSFLEAGEIDRVLVHPKQIVTDKKADRFTYYSHFRNVRHLNLVWLYRLWDGVYARAKKARKLVMRAGALLRGH